MCGPSPPYGSTCSGIPSSVATVGDRNTSGCNGSSTAVVVVVVMLLCVLPTTMSIWDVAYQVRRASEVGNVIWMSPWPQDRVWSGAAGNTWGGHGMRKLAIDRQPTRDEKKGEDNKVSDGGRVYPSNRCLVTHAYHALTGWPGTRDIERRWAREATGRPLIELD
jgi:hypothetical protein